MVPVCQKGGRRARTRRRRRPRCHRFCARSLPYDWDHLRESIRRNRRVLFVNEDTEVTKLRRHLVRRTVEEPFTSSSADPGSRRAFRARVGLADPSSIRRACRKKSTEIARVDGGSSHDDQPLTSR